MYTYVRLSTQTNIIMLWEAPIRVGLWHLYILFYWRKQSQSGTQDQYSRSYSVRLMDTADCSRRNSKHADFWQNCSVFAYEIIFFPLQKQPRESREVREDIMRTASPSLFNNRSWSALEWGNQPWMARVELLNNAPTRENEAAQKKKKTQKNSSTRREQPVSRKSRQHRKTLTQISRPFKHSAHPWKSYSIWSRCKIISQPSSNLICTSERLVLVLLHLQSPSVSVSPGWKTPWPRCGDTWFCIVGNRTCFRFLRTFHFSSKMLLALLTNWRGVAGF